MLPRHPPGHAGVGQLTQFDLISLSPKRLDHWATFRLPELPLRKYRCRIDERFDRFLAFCSRHRAPATCGFCHSPANVSMDAWRARLATLYRPWTLTSFSHWQTPECLLAARNITNAVSTGTSQKLRWTTSCSKKPVFSRLEKPCRSGIQIADWRTEAIVSQSSPEHPTTVSATLRQCKVRPGELCRAVIADIAVGPPMPIVLPSTRPPEDRKPRRIPIGRKLGELLAQTIETVRRSIFPHPRLEKRGQYGNLTRTYSSCGIWLAFRGIWCYLARPQVRCKKSACVRGSNSWRRNCAGHSDISTTQRYTWTTGSWPTPPRFGRIGRFPGS